MQPSTQYSFVEAACTTAGCQTGGVANVTTLDSAPVGQAPPSSSIPIPLPCPSNGMLPSNSLLPTPCPIESPALSPSQRFQLHTYNPSGILFYQINSVVTDFLGVKLHGGLPWLIFDVGSGPAVVGSNSTRTFNDGQWHTGYVVLFEQASNTLYVTMDTVHAAAITAAIVPLLTMKHVSYPLLNAPDGFDAVLVQNVGSTCMIVSWDLPTDSNGILINFSLYCNGALAGVLPLTVISYNTTGLLPFTLYMYMSSSHARRHCTPVGMWCWASSVPSCDVLGSGYETRDDATLKPPINRYGLGARGLAKPRLLYCTSGFPSFYYSSVKTIGPAMVDNQEDADSLCCYQCRGAITIRWQGTRARPVATWALCSQAQRYYKHVQRAHELQHARNVEKLEEKGRRVVKELEEARLQLKTSQAEVTTLKEECVEAKRRVQELLHFKEALLCTRKLCNHTRSSMAVGVSTYEGPVSFARAAPPPPVQRQGDDPSTPAVAGQYVPVASGSHYVGSVQTSCNSHFIYKV
ncbi:hypothetical protein EMCRGX_G015935 [Ephydatia muelleri]